MSEGYHYLIFGAGAIGGSMAAWLKAAGAHVSLYDRPQTVERINGRGLQVYLEGEDLTTSRVTAYSDLNQVPTPNVILLCIKNYSLADVSELLVSQYGTDIPIIALQNGVENQRILPQYFSKVLYGVVCYNAWVDSPERVGYQKKGPLALGYKGGFTDSEITPLVADINRAVDTRLCENLDDAGHSKIVINLTNSLCTLVAFHQNDLIDCRIFQKLLTRMTYEGMKVMKAAGYKESKLGGMPGWALITAAGVLPGFITRRAYKKNLRKMVISSMAQDIIVNGGQYSELETINGYVLSLAKAHNVNVPVNQVIYQMCKQAFASTPFTAVPVEDIWHKVERMR